MELRDAPWAILVRRFKCDLDARGPWTQEKVAAAAEVSLKTVQTLFDERRTYSRIPPGAKAMARYLGWANTDEEAKAVILRFLEEHQDPARPAFDAPAMGPFTPEEREAARRLVMASGVGRRAKAVLLAEIDAAPSRPVDSE